MLCSVCGLLLSVAFGLSSSGPTVRCADETEGSDLVDELGQTL